MKMRSAIWIFDGQMRRVVHALSLSSSTYTIGIYERAFAVELALVELAIVDDAVREREAALALFPSVFYGPHIRRL